MAIINHAKREINAKIVYFGSPGCGKGDLFNYIHQRIKPDLCGPLKMMPAGSDTLVFFDYIPYETSSLNGYRIRFHLYTLTGPVANPGTWRMTLKGLDGLAFITADDATGNTSALESLRVLRSMLSGYSKDLRSLPRLWLCCNDDGVLSGNSDFESCFDEKQKLVCSRSTGEGILQSLALLSQSVMHQLRQEYQSTTVPAASPNLTGDCDTTPHLHDAECQTSEIITLPEIQMSITGNSVVRIPVALQYGSNIKKCVFSLSLQSGENSL